MLQNYDLSNEAKKVLEEAIKLTKHYEEDKLKEFNKYLKVLENTIRENIYKYNFLMK